MEKINPSGCNVCVTGGAGYIVSWLVKRLLDKGNTVHATLRNLDYLTKIRLLKSFPGSGSRLVLFKADIYKPGEYEDASRGCEFIFHVATPFGSQSTSEATVASKKSIATLCARSGTVKRLIYTKSVFASSPLKDDGSTFNLLVSSASFDSLRQ